ncbi:MAG TPA: hypothetical protein VKT28_22315, partial [Puia sp.]|nr:hypothetical protein [Puia sp.]
MNGFLNYGVNFSPQLTILPDNSVLVDVGSNNMGLIMSKLNNYGDTIWSKSYFPPGFPGNLGPHKTIVDMDGNLFSVIANNYLVKLDTAGNILSANILSGTKDLSFKDAIILPDGDKVVLYNAPYDGNEPGVIARLDKNLTTVKWSQTISFYTTFLTNMVASGNSIFIGGGGTDMDYQFDLNTFISEIDANDGSIKKLKYFKAQQSYSNLFSLLINGDHLLGAGVFGNGNVNRDSGRYFYMRLDTSLNLLTAKRIVNTDNSNTDYNYIFLLQNDASILGTYGEYFQQLFFKIDKYDSMVWVKGAPSIGLGPTDLKQNADGFFVASNDNGTAVGTGVPLGQYMVSKINYDGTLDSCQSPYNSHLSLQTYIFDSFPNQIKISSYLLSLSAGQITSQTAVVNASRTCSTTSICDSVKIIGDSIYCNIPNSVFTAKKNILCHSAVSWSIVPESGSVIQQTSDSTISVRFSQSGNYKLYSRVVNSCGTISDSINV